MIKETIEGTTYEIIENNETLLVAKAMNEDVIFSLQYNKDECKKDGIDSTNFINIYYPKDDRDALMDLRNSLNKWLREKHSDKFI